MKTDFVLDVLEQASHARRDIEGLIHHSDNGSQYLSIRYGERLAESGIGSIGLITSPARADWRHPPVEFEQTYYDNYGV